MGWQRGKMRRWKNGNERLARIQMWDEIFENDRLEPSERRKHQKSFSMSSFHWKFSQTHCTGFSSVSQFKFDLICNSNHSLGMYVSTFNMLKRRVSNSVRCSNFAVVGTWCCLFRWNGVRASRKRSTFVFVCLTRKCKTILQLCNMSFMGVFESFQLKTVLISAGCDSWGVILLKMNSRF